MKKKEWICFFKGHSADDYGFCDRCANDYNDWTQTLGGIWYNVRYKIVTWFQRNIYYKCFSCGKTEFLFGKQIGNHKKCLPF